MKKTQKIILPKLLLNTSFWEDLSNTEQETIKGGSGIKYPVIVRFDHISGDSSPYKGCDPGTCC